MMLLSIWAALNYTFQNNVIQPWFLFQYVDPFVFDILPVLERKIQIGKI
jgi:hypothetical protein